MLDLTQRWIRRERATRAGKLVLAVLAVAVIGARPLGFCKESDCPSSTSNVPRPDATSGPARDVSHGEPCWAADAVFYQIFPERFRNGDPSNDPDRASLEDPSRVPDSWTVSSWTADWYSRAKWEQELGDDFYDHGVFDRRYGGDLQGVIDKLDYIENLSINAIYFNPVFYARSLHKYDANSFHHIDPHFGPDPAGDFAIMAAETADPASWQWTAADKLFLKLIADAHARGIRVIIDGVFNHSGRGFFAFADLQQRQADSPYRDWYIVKQFDDPATDGNEFEYAGWWNVETLPEFANSEDEKDLHAGPKKYIFDVTARWMDPDGDGDPSDGIDGWRLDVANEVPVGFWSDWNSYVRELNPEAYTVAEVWSDADGFLRRGGFSATMNYHGFAYPVKGFLIDNALSVTQFAADLDTRRATYAVPMQLVLQNLIDSHDTDRVASMIINAGRQPYENAERFDFDVSSRVSLRSNGDYIVRKPNKTERRIQRMVALFQMTYVGAPMIYYGTEAGMWGGDDPDDRMPMLWDDISFAPQQAAANGHPRQHDPVEFDQDLFDYYRSVIRLRRSRPSLRSANLELLATNDGDQTIAFARRSEGETTIVVFNRSDQPQNVELKRKSLEMTDSQTLVAVLASTGKPHDIRVRRHGPSIIIAMPPLTGAALTRVKATQP